VYTSHFSGVATTHPNEKMRLGMMTGNCLVVISPIFSTTASSQLQRLPHMLQDRRGDYGHTSSSPAELARFIFRAGG
jgi:hypothetical protein